MNGQGAEVRLYEVAAQQAGFFTTRQVDHFPSGLLDHYPSGVPTNGLPIGNTREADSANSSCRNDGQ